MKIQFTETNAQSPFPIRIPPLISTTGHRLANNSVKSHAHDYTELIMVTQGGCKIQTENTELSGSAGDLFVIPPELSHSQPEIDLVGTSYIGFYHPKNYFDFSFRVISLKNELYIPRWLDDLIDLHTQAIDNILYEELAVGILHSILMRIKQVEHHLRSIESMNPILVKATEKIHSNLTQVISVEDIAESANISSSYLTKLFKIHLNCSPMHYQQKLRMQLACRHLLNPYYTVKQISKKCGYDNVNLFIRLFKKNYKTSPGAWRKQFTEKT